MDLMLYASQNLESAESIYGMVCTREGLERKEMYHNFSRFALRLRRPREYETILVIVASNEKELADMLTIQHLLLDMCLLLILPDRKKETISMGHRLHPRFLSFLDDDMAEVSAVLDKIVRTTKCNKSEKIEMAYS